MYLSDITRNSINTSIDAAIKRGVDPVKIAKNLALEL